MEALNEICAANNASYDFLDSDFEEMKKPVTATIILVSIITNVTLLKPTMAKNAIHHNGTGDKGTSVYKS